MRSAAASTDPQFIAATLVKYEKYGEQVQEEAAALATCVAQLKDQQRTILIDALEEESNPVRTQLSSSPSHRFTGQ